MGKFIDLTGQRFGRLKVIEFVGNKYWNCQCDCGNIKNIYRGSLLGGATISCGCYNKEQTSKTMKTHGDSSSQEYQTWQTIKKRCYYKKAIQYKDYGGRGITVCDRWLNSYENFLADMGRKPTPKHSIERRDNEKEYSPNNCYWTTQDEQAKNKRNNVAIMHKETGIFYGTIVEGAIAYGIKLPTLKSQLQIGSPCKFIKI